MTPGRRERRADGLDLEARVSYLTADVQELSEQVTSRHAALYWIALYCVLISLSLLYLF